MIELLKTMEVLKHDNYFELILSQEKIFLDPPKIVDQFPVILTDISKNINKNKIFNSPGEYNIGDVYIWGLENKNYLVYFFESKEGNLIYSRENLSDETKKKIKIFRKNIDALFLIDFFNEDLVFEFKTKVILTNKNVNLNKFKKEKVNKIKINIKKVENSLFVFN